MTAGVPLAEMHPSRHVSTGHFAVLSGFDPKRAAFLLHRTSLHRSEHHPRSAQCEPPPAQLPASRDTIHLPSFSSPPSIYVWGLSATCSVEPRQIFTVIAIVANSGMH